MMTFWERAHKASRSFKADCMSINQNSDSSDCRGCLCGIGRSCASFGLRCRPAYPSLSSGGGVALRS
eukprot:1138933-Pelagomonas_calceolata.AAC.9